MSKSFARIALVFVLAAFAPAVAAVDLDLANARIRDTGGPIDNGWNLWSNGSIGDYFTVDKPGTAKITITAAGQPAAGVFPRARISAGFRKRFEKHFTVNSTEYKQYTFEVPVEKGHFIVKLSFLNDHQSEGEDRNLLVRSIKVTGAEIAASRPSVDDLIADRIQENRTGTITIKTAPNAPVTVKQQSHAFHFGTAISSAPFRENFPAADRQKFLSVLKQNFNAAVHENALKWYSTQPTGSAEPDYTIADRILTWCSENDITMRGHCIFWGVDKFVQPWLKQLNDTELRQALKKRALSVTSRYGGRIDEYDLNNEMLHGSYYRDRFGDGIIEDMAQWAKQGDPDAALYLNDYNVLSGVDAGRYVEQVRDMLGRGIPIGGIGCQGHFRGSIDLFEVDNVLTDLAAFDLPIKITEFDITTDDEQAQADYLADFYRVCFAHPAVDGILMWGFWEGAHWRPAAALYKRDWTPKPAARAYRDLVYNQWWTDYSGTADENGICTVPAFFGTHTVSSQGKTARISLTKDNRQNSVDFTGK